MFLLRYFIVFLLFLNIMAIGDECWSEFGENHYMVLSRHGAADYDGAVEKCLSLNASLVSIHSKEEHDYIEYIREETVGVPIWIGMRSFGHGLVYIWSDETPTDYLPQIERFNYPLDIACMYLYGLWYEGNCANSLHFVCKRHVTNSVKVCSKLTTTELTESITTLSEYTTTAESTEGISTSTAFDSSTTRSSTVKDINHSPNQNEITMTPFTEESTKTTTDTDVSSKRTTQEGTSVRFTWPTSYKTTPQDSSTLSTTPKNPAITTGHSTFVTKELPAPTRLVHVATEKLTPIEINEKVQEIVKKLKIYKLPKRPTREAPGGEAIGAVALFILLGIIGGIALLDLVTIQNHLNFFLSNIRGKPYKPNRTKKRKKLNDKYTQTDFYDYTGSCIISETEIPITLQY